MGIPVVSLDDLALDSINQGDLFLFGDEESQWGPEGPIEWTDEEVAWAREGLLRISLQDLLDPRLGEEKRVDIETWLNADVIHPFSFRVCAQELDCDPDMLREGIKRIIHKERTQSRRQEMISARIERLLSRDRAAGQFDWLVSLDD